MRSLLHIPLDPASRMIRLILAEKGLTVRAVPMSPNDPDTDLRLHNPAGNIPVLIDETPSGKEVSLSPAWAISEYLEEVYSTPSLFPGTSAGRAEMRRLVSWFCDLFEQDVITKNVRAKIEGGDLGRSGSGEDDAKKTAEAICWHFDYLSWLLEKRPWLAGETFSVADIAGGAYLSTIDYLGIAPWYEFPHAKDWYAKLKSRPSFQTLLQDRVPSLPPPAHYANLDF